MASSSANSGAGPLRGLGLRSYDPALIHIVPRAMQGSGRLVGFNFDFFASSFEVFATWFGPVLSDLDS